MSLTQTYAGCCETRLDRKKQAHLEDMLLGFHPESLRGCRLYNVFTGLLSDGLWFSDYEEGIRSSAFLLLPVEGHRSALSWRAGPQELYGLVLAGAGWDLFSCVQQPRACGLPGFSFSFVSARAGKGLAAPGCRCVTALGVSG